MGELPLSLPSEIAPLGIFIHKEATSRCISRRAVSPGVLMYACERHSPIGTRKARKKVGWGLLLCVRYSVYSVESYSRKS